jgi:anti-sigma-K factor RskA
VVVAVDLVAQTEQPQLLVCAPLVVYMAVVVVGKVARQPLAVLVLAHKGQFVSFGAVDEHTHQLTQRMCSINIRILKKTK